MKKFIVLWVILTCSSFISFPTIAMQSKQNSVAHEFICYGCKKKFKTFSSKKEHVLNVHYACLWCNDLDYLEKGAWKNLSFNDLQVRVDHIKKCFPKKYTSLWRCKECYALFSYQSMDHACGLKHQVNLFTDKVINVDLISNFEKENTCHQCPESKKFQRSKSYVNHIIRKHASCPRCSILFVNENKLFRDLTLDQRKTAADHLMKCFQLKNKESFFSCDTCFGIMLADRAVHINNQCKGEVSRMSENIDTSQETESFEFSQESVLLTEIVDEQDQLISSRFEEEYNNSAENESYLVGDFFTQAADLTIVYEKEGAQSLVNDKLICQPCNKKFTKVSSRIRHVLNTHYACPWCNRLDYLKKGDFQNISFHDRQVRLNHLKQCAQLQKKSSLWLCLKCFDFRRLSKNHKCGEDYQVNLILNVPLNLDVTLNFERETTCNKCPKQKKHRSIRSFKNHMLREHGACPCCSLQLTKSNKPLKNLNIQERQASANHLVQCIQLKNESLFVCDTCFGVKLGNNAGTHFKRSCKGLISEKTYRTQDEESLALDSQSVSLNQNHVEQLQELLSSSEEDTYFLTENSSTDCVINSEDQLSLEDFFKIINDDSVQLEDNPVGDTHFKSDFILDSAVCSSLYSQTRTESCGVSGHLSTS